MTATMAVDSAASWTACVRPQGLDNATRCPHCPQPRGEGAPRLHHQFQRITTNIDQHGATWGEKLPGEHNGYFVCFVPRASALFACRMCRGRSEVTPSMKNLITLQNHYKLSEMETAIAHFVARSNSQRLHESLDSMASAYVWFRRVSEAQTKRQDINRQTLASRRGQNLQIAGI